MTTIDHHDVEHWSQADFANLVGVCGRTVTRWRTEGRVAYLPGGHTQIVMLKSVNTSGPRCKGGRILIPVRHDSFYQGWHVLGAVEFAKALGAFDHVLALMEVGMQP